jgi:aspartokinase
MQKPWVVLKFGGTSVATVKTWESIINRTRELLPTNRVWIVVSALSKASCIYSDLCLHISSLNVYDILSCRSQMPFWRQLMM